jgi:hypothetical protein
MFPRITRISRKFFLVIRAIRGDDFPRITRITRDFFHVIRAIRGDIVSTDYVVLHGFFSEHTIIVKLFRCDILQNIKI